MSGWRGTAAKWPPNCARPVRRWSAGLKIAGRARRRGGDRGAARRLRSGAVSLRRGGGARRRQPRHGVAAASSGSFSARWFASRPISACVTIPARYLFGVTSALIALLAAGMAAQAIAFLEQANILTALDETVWDTSWLLSNSSYLGRRAAHLDRLCRSADRHAAHRLCGDTCGDRGADEAVCVAGGASAARRRGGVTAQAVTDPPAK